MKKQYYFIFLVFVIVLIFFLFYIISYMYKGKNLRFFSDGLLNNIDAKESNDYVVEIITGEYIHINSKLKSCFSGVIILKLIERNLFLEKYLPTKAFISCVKKKLNFKTERIKKGDRYLRKGYLYHYKGSYFTGKNLIKINR